MRAVATDAPWRLWYRKIEDINRMRLGSLEQAEPQRNVKEQRVQSGPDWQTDFRQKISVWNHSSLYDAELSGVANPFQPRPGRFKYESVPQEHAKKGTIYFTDVWSR